MNILDKLRVSLFKETILIVHFIMNLLKTWYLETILSLQANLIQRIIQQQSMLNYIF